MLVICHGSQFVCCLFLVLLWFSALAKYLNFLCAGFTPWQHMQSGDRSATDEVFMAAQEAVGAHRDSQGKHLLTIAFISWHYHESRHKIVPQREIICSVAKLM